MAFRNLNCRVWLRYQHQNINHGDEVVLSIISNHAGGTTCGVFQDSDLNPQSFLRCIGILDKNDLERINTTARPQIAGGHRGRGGPRVGAAMAIPDVESAVVNPFSPQYNGYIGQGPHGARPYVLLTQMALIAPMAAAGFSAGTIAATEAASWVGPPLVYAAYRSYNGRSQNLNSNSYEMSAMVPYQGHRKRNRVGHGGPNTFGHTKHGRRNTYRPYEAQIYKTPGRPYALRQNMGCEVVAIHKLVSVDLTSGTDSFFCLQPAEILNAPGLSRYTRLYDRMRFIKLKLEMFATDRVLTCITSASQNSKTTVSSKDVILRQPSLRFHNLKRGDGVNCARTFDIANVAGLGDHLATSSIATILSLTQATNYDAGIHGCILHGDFISAGGHDPQKIELKYTFVVEFMGQKQTMDAAAAEPNP